MTSPRTILKPARAPRSSPQQTRDRLVAAAAELFNREGLVGVDAARIAAEAGYAVGTFYRHFSNKTAILIATYERWATMEWREIELSALTDAPAEQRAKLIVKLVLKVHRKWQGLRTAFYARLSEPAIRKVYLRQRSNQLAQLKRWRTLIGAPPRPPEADALLVLTLERACDALAQGDLRELGLKEAALEKALVGLVLEAFGEET